MKIQTIAKPAPNSLPDALKKLVVNCDQAHIVDAQFIAALRGHARRYGWKLKTRRADLNGMSFGVWRVE